VAVGIPAQLLTRRPDVRRAERRLAAQCARIGIAESELYPRIAITGAIGYESENFSTLFQSDSSAGIIGPVCRWNILNYGRILNDVRAEEARFQQIVFNYQDTVLKANREVEDAVSRFLRENERVAFLQEGVTAAEESEANSPRTIPARQGRFPAVGDLGKGARTVSG
jgi:outer membrane protein TolC